MDIYSYIIVGALGLAIGSFLNVVIYRLPRKVKFNTIRSYCPKCKNQLKWYHNIPLFSYLFLLGKCSFCKDKISLRYPLVEFANLAFYLGYLFRYGLSYEFVIYSLISSALIVVFLIDLDFQIIPDSITYPGMIIGLAVSFLPDGIGIVNSLIGLLVGGGSLYLIAILGDFLFKKDSLGGGDIKLTAMLGTFLGWKKMLFIFMASAFIGLIISVALMLISTKLRKERRVPFGPFLAIAAVVAICWGDQLIALYIDLMLPQ